MATEYYEKKIACVSQDDDDGHLLALQIIRDLVDKGGDVFLDQLARLGVINKVSTLAGPASDDENEDEAKPEKVEAPCGVGGGFRFKLCSFNLTLSLHCLQELIIGSLLYFGLYSFRVATVMSKTKIASLF